MVLLTVWAGACAPAPTMSQVGGLPTPAQVVERLEARRVAVKSFIMQGEIEVETPEGDLYGDHLIQGVYPHRLRADVVGPMGRMVLMLVSDGVRLTVMDFRNNRAYQGPATRENLSRFLGLNLSVAEIFVLLSGNVPLLSGHQSALKAGPGRGSATLSILAPGGDVEQNLVFSLADYQVTSAQLQGWEGGYAISCEFEDMVKFPLGAYPRTIRLADEQKRRINILNDRLELNQPVEGRVFEAIIPPGIIVEELR